MGIMAFNEHIAANGTLNNNMMAQFCENSADKGGAIGAEYSEIIGSAYFEKNRAVDTVGNVEATVLHALPTSTEVAIDLNKPLLLETTADTAIYD